MDISDTIPVRSFFLLSRRGDDVPPVHPGDRGDHHQAGARPALLEPGQALHAQGKCCMQGGT